MNKKLILLIPTLTLLSGCSSVNKAENVNEVQNISYTINAEKNINPVFKDNFFTSKSVEFNIFTHKIILPGHEGNENSNTAIIQIWFEVKNKSDYKFTPTQEWLHIFSVTQGEKVLKSYPVNNKFIDNSILSKGEKAVYGLEFALKDSVTPVKITAKFEEKIVGETYYKIK